MKNTNIPAGIFIKNHNTAIRSNNSILDTAKEILLNRNFTIKDFSWLFTYYLNSEGGVEVYPIKLLYRSHAERVLNAHVRSLDTPSINDVNEMKNRIEELLGAPVDWSRLHYEGNKDIPESPDVYSLIILLSRYIDIRDKSEGIERTTATLNALHTVQRIVLISGYDGPVIDGSYLQ